MPPVGNDIVDLAAPGNPGKSMDGRFLGRVFTTEERALIAGSSRPDALLWALWAAKEAAYKAVSRGNPAACSIPRQYRVVLDTDGLVKSREFTTNVISAKTGIRKYQRVTKSLDPGFRRGDDFLPVCQGNAVGTAALLTGKVITPGGELALRIAMETDRVHALAADSEAALDRLCRHVEDLDVAGDPSAFIRGRLLREIARRLDCPVGDLSVVKNPDGPGAPGLLFRGRILAAEFSLSHDGRFAAFAFDPATL
ncbi:MAG: 4-phosphopantetheinyl transferase family protein [Deltaproteobacteria bacterium]|nr:4-phosphopantetheinyl transferase family protein [Deltaproteobacteria bacterium]